MKKKNTLHKICVGLTTLGLLVPNLSLVNGAEKTVTAKQSSPSIMDVSLAEAGILHGQVMSPQGQALANTSVAVYQGKNEIAKTTTDKDGRFAVQGLKGGVYVVATDGAAGVVRAWSPKTAPPSSVAGVLLVPQSTTTRAQLMQDGRMTNFGIGALVLGGVVATVIAVSIDHNSSS